MSTLPGKIWWVAALALVAPALHAYIGPGAGLSAIGSVLALVGALLLMIVGFVWYPVKRLMKRRKASAAESEKAMKPEEEASRAKGKQVKQEPAGEPETPKRH